MRVRKAVPLALAGALVLGCGTPEVPPKVVKLGAVLDRTGPLATAETVTVLDLALDHVNAGLKAAGYKDMQLAYVLTDNKTQPDVAVARALEIRTSDDVKGIIADGTQVVIALNRTMYDADASNDLNVPIIGTASNGPVINNPNVTVQQEADDVTRASYANAQKWVFRSTMPSSPAGGVIMQIAKSTGTLDVNGDGTFAVGTYAINDNFGRGGANGMKFAALAADPSAVVEQEYQDFGVNPNTYDYAPALDRLTDANTNVPDLIVETLSPQYSIAFTKQYIAGNYGTKTRLLHTAGFQSKAALDLLGESANGQEGVTTVVLDGASGTEFAAAFEEKLGYPPNTRDTMLYDGTMSMLLASIVAVQTNNLDDPTQLTGAQLRDAMSHVQDPAGMKVTSRGDIEAAVKAIADGGTIDYVGASGPMDFDAIGNNRQKLTRFTVENNKFVENEVFDCVAAPSCPKL